MRRQTRRSKNNQVLLPRPVLGIPRVELDDILPPPILRGRDRQRLLSNKPSNPLLARRGSERARVRVRLAGRDHILNTAKEDVARCRGAAGGGDRVEARVERVEEVAAEDGGYVEEDADDG